MSFVRVLRPAFVLCSLMIGLVCFVAARRLHIPSFEAPTILVPGYSSDASPQNLRNEIMDRVTEILDSGSRPGLRPGPWPHPLG
jgi:hypothetical protein